MGKKAMAKKIIEVLKNGNVRGMVDNGPFTKCSDCVHYVERLYTKVGKPDSRCSHHLALLHTEPNLYMLTSEARAEPADGKTNAGFVGVKVCGPEARLYRSKTV
jgi:hypothetical protein